MNISKLLLITAVLTALLASCGQDSAPGTAQKTTDQPASAAPPTAQPGNASAPEVYLYAVNVNNLLLRDQPTQKSTKVITKFKEGDFVTGQGEASDQREEANIRGMTMSEPYLKVESTTPEQHKGWAYGGALIPVYAGARSNSPDLGKLQQLSNFLTGLNVKKLESGKKAWEYVRANFSTASGSLADAGLILLERFLRRMEFEGQFYTLTEKITWADSDYEAIDQEKFDMNKYPQTKMLADNGFRLATGEGTVFPVTDWSKLEDFFGPRTTTPMRNFIHQQVAEQKEQAFDDGGLVIPVEKIADRAAFWEQFNAANPHFPLHEEALEHQRWTSLVMTNGADNTPVFNYDTQEVTPEFTQGWAYLVQKYPSTEIARVIRELQQLLIEEGNKKTKKVEAFQAKQAERYNQDR